MARAGGKKTENERWGAWEVASDRDGLKLETRKNLDTGLLQTRVAATIDASTDDLWKVLTIPESYMAVMPKTLQSVHLKEKPRQRAVVCYQRLAGGPSSDRDYTLSIRWTVEDGKHGKTYQRSWSVDNAEGPPPKKDVVRVERNDGSWTLEPLAGGKTRFAQVSYIELGGSLWTIVANAAVRDSALDLVRNLRARFP